MKARSTCRRRRGPYQSRLLVEPLELRLPMDASAGGPSHDEPLRLPPMASPAGQESGHMPEVRRVASAEELRQFLLNLAVHRSRVLLGADAYPEQWVRALGTPPTLSQDDFAGGYVTNTQVAGVGEGDRVTTAGDHLFILSDQHWLSIVDARDPAELETVARIQLEDRAQEHYVVDGRLIVIGSSWTAIESVSGDGEVVPMIWQGTPRTDVTVFDISEPGQPVLISETSLEGSLLASREVNGQIVLVTTAMLDLPPVLLVCEASSDGGATPAANGLATSSRCRYETEAEYTTRVGDTLLERALPDVVRRDAGAGNARARPLLAPEQIWLDGQDSWQLVVISRFDPSGEASLLGSSAVATSFATQLYARAEDFYVTGTQWNGSGASTRIFQFSVDTAAAALELASWGDVPGRVINSFALDEYEGRLRIATTFEADAGVSSSIHVLEAVAGKLEVMGSLTGLAPHEMMMSARFIEDRAFLVTFRRVDPVIGIDLSDPAQPRVVGELEMPGFSSYLHPWGEEYLIGVGRDADPVTGNWRQPAVSLLRVAEGSPPELVARHVLDVDPWSWSEAWNNHHAVGFDPSDGLLAIPVASTPPVAIEPIVPSDGRTGVQPMIAWVTEGTSDRSETGLWLFRLRPDAEDPITLLETLSHPTAVQRSVRLGDVLFVVSQDLVTSHAVADEFRELSRAAIGRRLFDDDSRIRVEDVAVPLSVLANDRVIDASRIVGVSSPTAGGTVRIAEDGRHLIYTPPAGERLTLHPAIYSPHTPWRSPGPIPVLVDTFTYTVDLGDGTEETASVRVSLERDHPAQKVAERARWDLSQRLEVDPAEIEIVRVTERDWPDACLEVTRPEEMCAQVITPGFVIVLRLGDRLFQYHGDRNGRVVLTDRVPTPPAGEVFPDEFRVTADQTDHPLNVLVNDFPGVFFIRAPRITSVSSTSGGGAVTITNDGLLLSYTPAAGFVGLDSFTYTVEDGQSAEVRVHVATEFPIGEGRPDSFEVAHDSVDNRLDVLGNDDYWFGAQQIMSVSGPSQGGSVTIAHDGKLLLYTPASGFSGTETFEYTDVTGATMAVTVRVLSATDAPGPSSDNPGGPQDAVELVIGVTDSEGRPLNQVELGDVFYVTVHVRDLRRNPQGVFSTYLDLAFDPKRAAVSGDIEYGPMFGNGQAGEVSAGIVDELGAFSSSLVPTGGDLHLLARVPFTAQQAGTWTVNSDPADVEVAHSMGLFGLDRRVSPWLVRFGSAEIDIVNGWHNERQPTDVNSDQSTTPLDVLAAVNRINAGGVGALRRSPNSLSRLTGEAESSRLYYDVNNDGHLTPFDPLLIVNWLNARQGEGESLDATAPPEHPYLLSAAERSSTADGLLGDRPLAADSLVVADRGGLGGPSSETRRTAHSHLRPHDEPTHDTASPLPTRSAAAHDLVLAVDPLQADSEPGDGLGNGLESEHLLESACRLDSVFAGW